MVSTVMISVQIVVKRASSVCGHKLATGDDQIKNYSSFDLHCCIVHTIATLKLIS